MNKTIRNSTREVIYKVFQRCLGEFEAQTILSELDNVYQRTADMAGKSVSIFRRIVEEGRSNSEIFSTPGMLRQGRSRKELYDFLPVIRGDLGFNGSLEYLRKIILALGFKCKKCQSEYFAKLYTIKYE